MFFKKLKKALTPSLSTMIRRQISAHKSGGYSFSDEIILIISKDYGGPYISATLKSTDPNVGGISDSDQIWFYKCRVDSFLEAFDKLTTEVSAAKIKYPNLEFFRWLKIPANYPSDLIKDWPRIDQGLKAKIVNEGSHWKAKTIHLYEIYTGGSWAIYDNTPWASLS